MDQEPANSASALEQFRQQWRQEVKDRSRQQARKSWHQELPKPPRKDGPVKHEPSFSKPASRHAAADIQDDDVDQEGPSATPDVPDSVEVLSTHDPDEDEFAHMTSRAEPESALEHFERAVEKEGQGNLGDSLSHYRKAYRMDAKVDQTYKQKHFALRWKVPNEQTDKNEDVSVQATHSSPPLEDRQAAEPKNLSFPDLIASFAGVPIENIPPIIAGDIPPPCPVQRLPAEVLVELLIQVATLDPAILARLGLVCKSFAFHVYSESSAWKRVALGPQFGLAGQHYTFATDVQGREAICRSLEDDDAAVDEKLPPVDATFFPRHTDWRELFRQHPRIRYTGLYISTVNYTRAGTASATVSTWLPSISMVTYYRYLRFFRDGTCISLLTTHEPIEVVHHLTKQNLAIVRAAGKEVKGTAKARANTAAAAAAEAQSLPPTVHNILKHALRGRWRLCHPALTDPSSGLEIASNIGVAGDLHIETEGASPRYVYTMHMALKSGSKIKHTRNNKLQWKGLWGFNTLSGDWSEFGLRNDKPFYFSRVKSYGLGYP